MYILTTDCMQAMTDDELCEYVIASTGVEALYCAHCKCATPIRERWAMSLRRRLVKLMKSSGLITMSSSIAFPKTCDSQTLKNDKSNPINNTFYPLIRKAFKKGDIDEVETLQKTRGILHITENSIIPYPHKYPRVKAPLEYYIDEPPVKKTIKLRLRPSAEAMSPEPTFNDIIQGLTQLTDSLKARLVEV